MTYRISVHDTEDRLREGNLCQFGWTIIEQAIPLFSLRFLYRQLIDEGYDDTSILIERE